MNTRTGEHALVRQLRRATVMAAIAFATAGICVAPPATADASDSLRAAVSAVPRAACAPLRSDPVIDQAAAKINATTDEWINFTARAVPETDALPLLKDLGYGGDRSAILSGAASTDANAIKVVILQGYAKIPDCSYSGFGVNAMYNAKKDMILTTIVLAG